jgi:hypothetical protein
LSNWTPPYGSRLGACLCGATRFEVRSIYDVVYCHCSKCRRWAGAPVVLTAQVPAGDFRVVAGAPVGYRSSKQGTRHFCGTCGTHLWFTDGGPYVGLNVMLLDDTSDVRPRLHQCVSSKLDWFEIADELPRYPGNTLPALGRER